MKLPEGYKEGIYFNMSNDDYHKDFALSHSGMTQLLVSWQDYWERSAHNPKRSKYLPTDAMIFGDRAGQLLLDPKGFHERFNTYNRPATAKGGIYLSSVEYNKLKESVEAITSVPVGKSHFSEGYPEVSIFWRDPATKIMLRVKIDYLRTFGAIDYKRIRAVDNYTIGRAVKTQGLDIQNFIYLAGIQAARVMLREYFAGKRADKPWHGEVDLDWLKAFSADEDLLFRFFFQRSEPPYIWKLRDLHSEVVAEGQNAMHKAMLVYLDSAKRFKFGPPPMGTGDVGTITQFHIPRRDYDYE